MATRQDYNYQTDVGSVGSISLSTTKGALAGTPPVGPPNPDIRVYEKKNNKKYGVRARYALYYRLIGTDPDTVKKYIQFAHLTTTSLQSAPSTVDYKSFTWTLARRVPEDVN